MLDSMIYVGFGAIFGAVARFFLTHLSSELSHHHGFPYGTLIVNVVGAVIAGYVLTWSSDHTDDTYRLLIVTGFCGAFTTFSSYAFESMAYWHEGKMGLFALNILTNNVLALAGVIVGIQLHKA